MDIVVKQKKFNMDKLAFSQGYAYKWINIGGGGRERGRRPNSTAQSRNDETTESDSSLYTFSLPQTQGRSSGAPAPHSYKPEVVHIHHLTLNTRSVLRRCHR